MTCDDVRARLIDGVVSGRATLDADVSAHLESCASCRAMRDDYGALWRQLGELPVPQPPRAARAPLVTPRRPPWYVSAWAAAVLFAALAGSLAGYSLGVHRATDRARISSTTPTGGVSTFLILLHVDSTFRHGQTPAASAAMFAEYVQWANQLPTGVTLVGTASLVDSTVWFGPPREVSARGDHLAGFLMVRAKDPTAAMRLAATAPHLKYGGRVELRMIR